MPRVILHAGQPLDDVSDPGEGPEAGAKPVRPRSLAQGGFDAIHLGRRQPGLAAGAAGRPQGRAPAPTPRAVPPHDALAADPLQPGDRALRLSTRGKQTRGPVATNFQPMEIPSWRMMGTHAPIIRSEPGNVTLLCEIQ
jgi:hypothetical protein